MTCFIESFVVIVNLFIFPFAGGSSYSFEFFKKNGLTGIHALDYPGRGKKLMHPSMDNVFNVVDSLYDEIKNRLNGPYCFYGHSMGTLISYLLIQKLKSNNQMLPHHLFVSGRGAPSVPIGESRHDLPHKEFWQRIKELGGCPDEVLENADLMDFFEPILRTDLKAIETYQYEDAEPLKIPITILLGKDDKVTSEEAILWQKETIHPIDIQYFDGGHFFILDHAKEISDLMKAKMSSYENV